MMYNLHWVRRYIWLIIMIILLDKCWLIDVSWDTLGSWRLLWNGYDRVSESGQVLAACVPFLTRRQRGNSSLARDIRLAVNTLSV